jgi:hypothetical protein
LPLGYLKKKGEVPLAKKFFFWEKRPIIFWREKKLKLNSPYLDHRFFVYRQYMIKILLFSLTFTQIWLNPPGPLVKDRQSTTYLTKSKKKTLKFPTRLAGISQKY